jgi:polyisoprenyl-phosphate glycosyltransferase
MASSTPMTSPMRVAVLMPLQDDWTSASELIRRLDRTFGAYPCILNVLLVDDGSVQPCTAADFQSDYSVVRTIGVLRLRRNLGHQRAIAIGLVHLARAVSCDAVLVMDADGEDTAEGALQLLREYFEVHHGAKAIFAERSRRTETLAFRVLYNFYKILHLLLTGISVRVGNFSVFPPACLSTLVVMSELWNHYAAAFFRSGLPFTTIPIPRGCRIAGRSRMNFVSLVTHGMSAISVFADVVGVRLLIASMAGSLMAVLGVLAVVAIRLFTDKAVPGWATYTVGTLIVILIQFAAIATSFTFTMLSNRATLSFVPLRDYEIYVMESLGVYSVA